MVRPSAGSLYAICAPSRDQNRRGAERKIEAYDFGAKTLHGEGQEATSGPNLQYTFAAEFKIAEVGVLSAAEIPFAILDRAIGELHGVVKEAVGKRHARVVLA